MADTSVNLPLKVDIKLPPPGLSKTLLPADYEDTVLSLYKQKAPQYQKSIETHSRLQRVDPNLVAAIIGAESSWNPNKKGQGSSLGFSQGKDAAVRQIYGNLTREQIDDIKKDPDKAVEFITKMLRRNQDLALKKGIDINQHPEYIGAYNLGEGAMITKKGADGTIENAVAKNKKEVRDWWEKVYRGSMAIAKYNGDLDENGMPTEKMKQRLISEEKAQIPKWMIPLKGKALQDAISKQKKEAKKPVPNLQPLIERAATPSIVPYKPLDNTMSALFNLPKEEEVSLPMPSA